MDAKQISRTIIELLKQHNITNLVPEIIEHLQEYHQISTSIVHVESGTPLSQETLNQIIDILTKKLGYKPTLEHSINPKLIAGLRIKVQDQLIDASLKRQIEQVFENLH